MTALDIITAPVFEPATCPEADEARYIGVHGGRGSGKSHMFAEKLVERCLLNSGTHAVCIREVQKSLDQSVKRTVEQKIEKFGAGRYFNVQRSVIRTPGNGLIIFQGMQNHTADSLKSLQDYDIAWVEEAQALSKRSLKLLRPTMRLKRSQIWFSWNPDLATDPVDDFLRGNSPKTKQTGWTLPPRSIVVEANWQHNPWFSETELVEEKDYDFKRDKDMYAHVWLGAYETKSEARVFKRWRVEWFERPPAGTIIYLGADWGMTADPSVLVACFIIGNTLYVWREVYKLEAGNDVLPAAFDQIDPDWTPQRVADPNWRSLARKHQIIADSSEPRTIDFMQKAGFSRMVGAIKGPNSVEEGVRHLQSYDIVVHPDCKHVEKELLYYSFKIDKKTEEVTSILEDNHNHVIDALRYALENVRRNSSVKREELR